MSPVLRKHVCVSYQVGNNQTCTVTEKKLEAEVLDLGSKGIVLSILRKKQRCCVVTTHLISHLCFGGGGGEGARWLSGRALNHRLGVQNLPQPCYVLDQGTLPPENTIHTQEAVAASRHY